MDFHVLMCIFLGPGHRGVPHGSLCNEPQSPLFAALMTRHPERLLSFLSPRHNQPLRTVYAATDSISDFLLISGYSPAFETVATSRG